MFSQHRKDIPAERINLTTLITNFVTNLKSNHADYNWKT